MSYNVSFMNTSNNLLDVFTGVSNSVGSIFVLFIMLLVWIFVFTRLLDDGVDTAGMVASFVTSIVGGLFVVIGVFSWEYLLLPVTMVIVFFAIKKFGGR